MVAEPTDGSQGTRIRSWSRVTLACTAVALSLTVLRVAQLKIAPPERLDAAAGRRTSDRKERWYLDRRNQ